MAGDWIKIRDDLPDDPEVIAMALYLKISQDEVVGKLIRFWIWCDRHLAKGDATGVTKEFLDRHVCVTGFADALEKVGWLELKNEGINIPKFENHLSQSAKIRSQTRDRNIVYRDARRVTKTHPEIENREREDVSDVSKETSSRVSWKSQIEIWNERVCKALRVPPIESIEEHQRRSLRLRLKDHPDMWDRIMAEAPLLTDWAKEKRFYKFSWFLSPTNLSKFINGDYRRKDAINASIQENQLSQSELDAEYVRRYGQPGNSGNGSEEPTEAIEGFMDNPDERDEREA